MRVAGHLRDSGLVSRMSAFGHVGGAALSRCASSAHGEASEGPARVGAAWKVASARDVGPDDAVDFFEQRCGDQPVDRPRCAQQFRVTPEPLTYGLRYTCKVSHQSIEGGVMIHIKLGERRALGPDDPMGRDWVGYDPTVPLDDLFGRNRGRRSPGSRADRERYAAFSYTGDHTVKLLAEINGFEPFANKRAIIGEVLPADHPLARQWVGEEAPDRYRNPVMYCDETGAGIPICACGCGETVPANRSFVPGHDQKAIHQRITREWGGTIGFIEWFDVELPPRIERRMTHLSEPLDEALTFCSSGWPTTRSRAPGRDACASSVAATSSERRTPRSVITPSGSAATGSISRGRGSPRSRSTPSTRLASAIRSRPAG